MAKPKVPAADMNTGELDLNSDQEKQVEVYNRAVEDYNTNAEHDFYNGVPPRPLPAVPQFVAENGDLTGNYMVPASAVPFRYQKVTLPNGKTFLAIILTQVQFDS